MNDLPHIHTRISKLRNGEALELLSWMHRARGIFLNPTSGVCMKHGRLGARRRKPSRSQVARKVCPKARGWKVLGEVNPGEPDFSRECHWRDEKLQGRQALRETTSKPWLGLGQSSNPHARRGFEAATVSNNAGSTPELWGAAQGHGWSPDSSEFGLSSCLERRKVHFLPRKPRTHRKTRTRTHLLQGPNTTQAR
jgi:hypothetical protein